MRTRWNPGKVERGEDCPEGGKEQKKEKNSIKTEIGSARAFKIEEFLKEWTNRE